MSSTFTLLAKAQTTVLTLLLLLPSSSALAVLPDFISVFENNVNSVITVKVLKAIDKSKDGQESVTNRPKVTENSKLKKFFEKHFDGKAKNEIATGSGVVATQDGYLFTASHLVENAKEIWVYVNEKKKTNAKLIGFDKSSDIAILKIRANSLQVPVTGDTSSLKVGQWVLSIGTPFGFEKSASQGIISALNRKLPNSKSVSFIQTDVAVNPGNSGGPLFNTQGELIAINSQIYSKSGGYQGVAFAVPIENAIKVLEDFMSASAN